MDQGKIYINGESNQQLRAIQNGDCSVQIIINSVMHKVSNDTPIDTSLNTFIRDVLKLKGTKAMCHEGGCGACIVAVETNGHVMSVNSCLVPIYICDGWKITTIEGVGNREKGYHTLQAALADMNGSQCGFCSPGWVMNMFSLSQKNKMTMEEIENSFASNLCRCTGYRPILDAFKSFASDAPPAMASKIKDIEEIYKIQSCKNCSKNTMCNGTCDDPEIICESSIPRIIEMELSNSVRFYKVSKTDHVFDLFKKHPDATYIINGGNTAHGVYRSNKIQIYIDVNDIPDLHKIEKDKDSLILGANVTLSMAKQTFEKYADEPGFKHLRRMAKHIDLIASIPIRNIGTIAGNLMIKNAYLEFPSDMFLILEAAGAQIHILESPGSKTNMTLLEFLNTKMHKKLMYSIVLPALNGEYVYNSYKIMPRAQNAHAIVNAGFLFKPDSKGKLLEKPNIIFGGIRPDFLHATKTEEFLKGKSIYDVNTIKKALSTLLSELNPDYVLPDYKPKFRKLLAVSLLYKFILKMNDKNVNPKFRSGGSMLKRGLSSGKQDYDTDRNLWPVNQPMPKVGSIYQTSGEGEYINDIPTTGEVFCALTLAEMPGVIEKIAYEQAMNVDGVIAFYSAKDIPGKNAFVNADDNYANIFLTNAELLFADKEVSYAGQPYGIIVAKSHNIAQYAASKVKIVFTEGPQRKPMISVHDVLASSDKTRVVKAFEMAAEEPAGNNIKHRIKGNFEVGSQYHFTMEPQTCVCVPIEDGMDVFAATQNMDLTQTSVAATLGVPINTINVKVRRLGGGYGAKVSRATQIACACALVSRKLNRAARLVLSIEDNMRSMGKRTPAYFEYDLGVDAEGKIQRMDMSYWGNVGDAFNESHSMITIFHFQNCYDASTWNMVGFDVRTDLPSNTWCRSPGSTEGIAAIEHVMERIARVTGKDALDVKMINMNAVDRETLAPMMEELKKSSDYEKRKIEVEKFNQENRWKKRGLSFVLMKYPHNIWGNFHSLVSIYARDGTVSITHAGIEMGQGIHTKIAQVAAHTLGIDINMISVKPSNCLTAPNSTVTGGTIGSDTCGYATLMACKELLKRLQPIKEKLGPHVPWKTLVFEAHLNNIDLCASHMFSVNQEDIKPYAIYGVTVSEVEVDVLTGQHLIHRVDIMEDTGVSLSPEIDVGQVEGAFVMGIGYWTCEDLIYDPETGGLTNYRTWNYKVSGAKDIPVDFRVSFRRNAPNPTGILRSKATGEPPLCMACSIPIAIRQALDSARADAGNNDLWYQLDNALTLEKILLNSLTSIDEMIL